MVYFYKQLIKDASGQKIGLLLINKQYQLRHNEPEFILPWDEWPYG